MKKGKIIANEAKKGTDKIEDVFCVVGTGQTACLKSILKPAQFLKINGKLAEKVLRIGIENQAGTKGFVELSIDEGDYQKYVSIPLKEKELVKMFDEESGAVLNVGEDSARIFVKYKGDDLLHVCYISARYNEEITIIERSGRFKCYGEKYESHEAYKLAQTEKPKHYSHKSFFA